MICFGCDGQVPVKSGLGNHSLAKMVTTLGARCSKEYTKAVEPRNACQDSLPHMKPVAWVVRHRPAQIDKHMPHISFVKGINVEGSACGSSEVCAPAPL